MKVLHFRKTPGKGGKWSFKKVSKQKAKMQKRMQKMHMGCRTYNDIVLILADHNFIFWDFHKWKIEFVYLNLIFKKLSMKTVKRLKIILYILIIQCVSKCYVFEVIFRYNFCLRTTYALVFLIQWTILPESFSSPKIKCIGGYCI